MVFEGFAQIERNGWTNEDIAAGYVNGGIGVVAAELRSQAPFVFVKVQIVEGEAYR